MDNQNFETFIDFGSSKIRVGVFDKTYTKKNFFTQKNCETNLNKKNLNIQKAEKIVEDLIKNSEKKIGQHLKSVNIIIDSPDLLSVDLSIRKNFEGKLVYKDDIKYLLQEAKQLIQSNYINNKLIHIIIQKFLIDDEIYYSIPEEKINCKKFILEVKFICISNILYDELKKNLIQNHLSINQIYSSSYVKSLNYCHLFENYEKKFFLDIGYKKSCLTIYDSQRLILINTIPVGGNHITSDISKIAKISEEDAEVLKKTFNQTNVTFSNKLDNEFIINPEIKSKINNKISLDTLNKVIHARIDEIFQLSFKNINIKDLVKKKDKCILILTGSGSKILNKNSIYLEEEFNYFNEINFFEETDVSICQAAFNFDKVANVNEVSVIPKKTKKSGFFEKLFNLFQ